MKNRYKVTIEHLMSTDGSASTDNSLQFEVENHDDIFAIVKRLEARGDFSPEEAKAFGVGLKLFSEVMLDNRQLPLFSSFIPHFVGFMKELKKG